MQVNILEAKSPLSQLIKSAQAGEEVIIANRGTPAVRLVPVSPALPTREPGWNPGSSREFLAWLQRHPLPDYARRSAAQMDADIDEERASWD
jgi:prevent-host-death family protein